MSFESPPPNHARQRTRPSRSRCNPMLSWLPRKDARQAAAVRRRGWHLSAWWGHAVAGLNGARVSVASVPAK